MLFDFLILFVERLDRISRRLKSVEQKEILIMASIADIQAAVSAISQAVDDNQVAVLAEIARLQAEIASGSPDPAVLQSIVDSLSAASTKLGVTTADAVAAQ